jgi:glycosyltransferase involved in cell wall biosynthesis
MTAALGAYIAKKKNSKLYLDIRDLFADTMSSLLNKKFIGFLIPFINLLEKWTFSSADKINVVSGGFLDYFYKNYPKINPSVYTNGIDENFSNIKFSNDYQNKKTVILYAGNIGEGQGLDKIIPKVASENQNIFFKIIGDGSSRKLLIENNLIKTLNNVEIIDPISREDLIMEYKKADILFIHLNDYKAFHRVLPSKIFEYAALNKPILAGVSGYAAEFLTNHVSDTEIFKPCDHKEMSKSIQKIIKKNKLINRNNFISKFKRKNIMKNLAKDILSLN